MDDDLPGDTDRSLLRRLPRAFVVGAAVVAVVLGGTLGSQLLDEANAAPLARPDPGQATALPGPSAH